MTDPKRLSELGSEAPDALRGLLRASRDDLPGAERLEGLAARLGPLLGGAGVTAEPGAPDAPPGPQTPPADPSAAATAASGSGAVAKAVGVGAAIVGPRRGSVATYPARSGDQRGAERLPAGHPRGSHFSNRADGEPGRFRSEHRPVAIRPGAGRAAREAAGFRIRPSQASGPSESALLAQAQAALQSNPSRALALTREHKRRFPNGALAQEREVIAIEALKRMGDGESARKRAKDFENSYPGSAHRRKVENPTKP